MTGIVAKAIVQTTNNADQTEIGRHRNNNQPFSLNQLRLKRLNLKRLHLRLKSNPKQFGPKVVIS